MMASRMQGLSWRTGMRSLLLLVLLSTVMSSVACLGRSPNVEHYVLGSSASSSAATASGLAELAIVIGPVRLPAYLDRPQVARLETGGEIELDEFSRWLGGFEENFLRALALDVAARTDSIRVTTHPSKAPFPADVRVRLHVDDLVTENGSSLRVRIRWALIRSGVDGPPTLAMMETSIPLTSSSSSAIVAAYDKAIEELGRRIVARLLEGAG